MKQKTAREYAFDRFNEAFKDPNANPRDVRALSERYLAACLAERVRPNNRWLASTNDSQAPTVRA